MFYHYSPKKSIFILTSKYIPTHIFFNYSTLLFGLLIVDKEDFKLNNPHSNPTTTGPVGANKPVSINVNISFNFDSNVSPNTIGSVPLILPIFVVGDSITTSFGEVKEILLLLNIPISPPFFVLSVILSELIKIFFPSYGDDNCDSVPIVNSNV